MQSMMLSFLGGIADSIVNPIKNLFLELVSLIPKVMYLLYASVACVLDAMQLFFRKLAGLDVYYVGGTATQGDLVTNFITGILGINGNNSMYPALSTVFWSMLIFGVVLALGSTFVALIRAHYSYDEKAAKAGPMQYVYTGVKAIVNMVCTPIIIVLALWVSTALLTALDSITITTSGNVVSTFGSGSTQYLKSAKDKSGTETYIAYDMFGYSIMYEENDEAFAKVAAKTETFSGSMFRACAYQANRARNNDFFVVNTAGIKSVSDLPGKDTIFVNYTKFDPTKYNSKEAYLADMIDTAFACSVHLKDEVNVNYRTIIPLWDVGNISGFSKFDIGTVWVYYDLWKFNFIIGFAGVITCVTLFLNIILGLIQRIFMCVILFLIQAPLFAIAPLDNGKAAKGWFEQFRSQLLMAFGAVVGMNLMLMLLPYLTDISFFNIEIVDYLINTIIVIAALVSVKAVIATLSKIIGGADAQDVGSKMAGDVASTAGKATKLTMASAKVGMKAVGVAAKPLQFAGGAIDGATGNHFAGAKDWAKNAAKDFVFGKVKEEKKMKDDVKIDEASGKYYKVGADGEFVKDADGNRVEVSEADAFTGGDRKGGLKGASAILKNAWADPTSAGEVSGRTLTRKAAEWRKRRAGENLETTQSGTEEMARQREWESTFNDEMSFARTAKIEDQAREKIRLEDDIDQNKSMEEMARFLKTNSSFDSMKEGNVDLEKLFNSKKFTDSQKDQMREFMKDIPESARVMRLNNLVAMQNNRREQLKGVNNEIKNRLQGQNIAPGGLDNYSRYMVKADNRRKATENYNNAVLDAEKRELKWKNRVDARTGDDKQGHKKRFDEAYQKKYFDAEGNRTKDKLGIERGLAGTFKFVGANVVFDSFAQDSLKKFLEESDIKPKPRHDEATASNTKSIVDELKKLNKANSSGASEANNEAILQALQEIKEALAKKEDGGGSGKGTP